MKMIDEDDTKAKLATAKQRRDELAEAARKRAEESPEAQAEREVHELEAKLEAEQRAEAERQATTVETELERTRTDFDATRDRTIERIEGGVDALLDVVATEHTRSARLAEARRLRDLPQLHFGGHGIAAAEIAGELYERGRTVGLDTPKGALLRKIAEAISPSASDSRSRMVPRRAG